MCRFLRTNNVSATKKSTNNNSNDNNNDRNRWERHGPLLWRSEAEVLVRSRGTVSAVRTVQAVAAATDGRQRVGQTLPRNYLVVELFLVSNWGRIWSQNLFFQAELNSVRGFCCCFLVFFSPKPLPLFFSPSTAARSKKGRVCSGRFWSISVVIYGF